MSTAAASKGLPLSVAGFALVAFFLAMAPVPSRAQLSTDDHMAEPGWWPRRKPASLKEFAGNVACAKCHSRIMASQETTAMARTLMRAADADALHSHLELSFRNGNTYIRSRQRMRTACPFATKDCITCHTPKIDNPDMHTAFADHLIRVVRPGARVPD